jgi:aryl-alcohol dehydrogenase-like predicted oxidoreductase
VRYANLGRSGLSVSRFCLGSLNFGPVTDAASAHQIMDAALEAGVNFLDTSNSYGRHLGRGAAEQIIGGWFAQGGGRRERVVLATKLYVQMDERPNSGGLSALNIRQALDASLRRLRTDYIDLYQFHHIDRDTPWDEIWQAVETAVSQGKILYAGSSNFAGWHLAKAQEAAMRRGLSGLASEQSIYNLVRRDVEREVLPAARDYGIGLLPWSPLHEGLLGGALRREEEGHRRLAGRAAAALDAHREQLGLYEELAAQAGLEPAVLALSWLLHQPGVVAPVVGSRTVAQLKSALCAVEVSLSRDVLDRLDEIFPGYKTAPEDYAW